MASQEDVFKKLIAHCKGIRICFSFKRNLWRTRSRLRLWSEWCWTEKQHQKILVGQHGIASRKHRGHRCSYFHAPTTWKASGHVDAFNDRWSTTKTAKTLSCRCIDRRLAGKITTIKSTKKLKKAAKRFGESFDAEMFKQTNERVKKIRLNGRNTCPLQKSIERQQPGWIKSYHRRLWSSLPDQRNKTGPMFVSSILCSPPKWVQLPMAQWRFICAPKQLRESLWTTWTFRKPVAWKFRLELLRLVKAFRNRL